ncbi:MAG: DUF3267 domain-containing protein [Clostridiales bacterium]|nr:DUF3267 domain-containing protein [Clostridiales bacterium]
MKKERVLTEKEEQRKCAFEEKAEKLISEGYTQKNLIIGVVQANILAIIIMLPFAIVLGYIGCLVGNGKYQEFNIIDIGLFFVLMIVLMVIHELIHGITWGLFAENHWKDIEFGIIWKMLTPYCTCKSALTKLQYIIGGLMPTLILGFGLGLVAIIIGNMLLFLLAELMIFGGGGDFLIAGKLLMFRTKYKDCIYMDHPTECGLVAFYR